MIDPLYVAFVWHMHQPLYRRGDNGRYDQPWVRLHAVKDYLHVAHIIADYPTINQTINVVPSLGIQILEYAAGTACDRVLELSLKLTQPGTTLSEAEQREVLDSFFTINWDHFLFPHPFYRELTHAREQAHGDLTGFTPQYFVDLAVWYNLAWIDPSERARDRELSALVEKGHNFDRSDLKTVLVKHHEICAAIIPTYRALARRQQLEMTTSPFFHPILPLLIDSQCARQASPNLPLPRLRFRYPDDARRQIVDALAFHQETFGELPRGLWPPEGAISQDAVNLLASFPTLDWIASDEHVLARSLGTSIERDESGHVRQPEVLYQPYLSGDGPAIFFRDQTLSDRVGFVYQYWNSVDAANDLVERLLHVRSALPATAPPAAPPIVSIVLDGENCWETYPNNGDDFLRALFGRLSREPSLKTVTPSQYLQLVPSFRDQLPRVPSIVAGSWIGSNLETWIGEPDQNRAWEFLAAARHQFEVWKPGESPAVQSARDRAWRSLEVAEGSDWFWWYYSRNRVPGISAFDRHFRDELAAAYRAMDQPIPAGLDQPVYGQATEPHRDALGPISPRPLTAREDAGPEWASAGYADLDQSTGAMQAGQRPLRRIYAGYDHERLYVRVELGEGTSRQAVIVFVGAPTLRTTVHSNGVADELTSHPGDVGIPSVMWQFRVSYIGVPGLRTRRDAATEWTDVDDAIVAIGDRAVELAVPLSTLGLGPASTLDVTADLASNDARAARREELVTLKLDSVARGDRTSPVEEGAHGA